MKILLLSSLLLISSLSFAQKRAMTTDDGLNMINLSGAYLSPDGDFAIYGKSTLNWDKNKRETTYHYVSADGGDSFQYIGKAGASSIQFSPDGKHLSFKRAVDKKQQIFTMRTAGGEAVQLTKHKNSIGAYKWSADSKRIFFVASTPRSKEEEKEYKAGYDHVFIDEGPNGQREGKWNNIFVYDLEDEKITKLTKGELLVGSFDVSPDGKQVVYTSRTENRRNQGNLSEIFMLSLSDSTTTQVTTNEAPESRPMWNPDGKSFAYTAPDDKTWELKNAKIFVREASTKKNEIVSGELDGSIRSAIYWGPKGESVYFSAQTGTFTNIYELNVATKQMRNITGKTAGTYSLRDMSRDRSQMIFTYSDIQTPNDLYISSTSSFEPKQLTDLNPGFKDKYLLADGEVIKWKSKDDLEIEGIMYAPTNHRTNGKDPLLLHIHGGPAGSFRDAFSYRYHVYAGLGYVQLAPNVRGSSGYSDDLLRGNMRDIGGMDYEDLMSGVDKLVADKHVDKDKMAVRGWSYGGILGGTTITKTNRFKAASLGAMVSDWTSEYGIGFNFDVRRWYIGGTFWENPEGYRQKSALTHVQKIETPTLLLHGARDRTDTEAQSMMFFAALKDLNKTVRYIQFPREPHGFREPRHQRTRDIEEIRWIQKYTLGLDWKPWEREKKEEKTEKPDNVKLESKN